MKNKKGLMGILALVLAVCVLLGVYLAARPETAAGEKVFTVSVVHKDGTEKEFVYTTDEEYLGAVLVEEGLVEGQMGPYGLMISAVDGESADWNLDRSYWALYIGGEYATTGADTTAIHDGDAFRLEYTIG